MDIERDHLLPMAEEGFDLADLSFPVVDGSGCVRVKRNWYSTPLRPGTKVRVKASAGLVEIWKDGRMIARHQRCYGAKQQIFELEHYLDVLERKPGAFSGSRPLQQWREKGRWTESYDVLLQKLIERHGKQSGTREMIELLKPGRAHGYQRLEAAISQALRLGCADGAAVRHLFGVAEGELRHSRSAAIDIGALIRYERSMPVLSSYDELLGREAAR